MSQVGSTGSHHERAQERPVFTYTDPLLVYFSSSGRLWATPGGGEEEEALCSRPPGGDGSAQGSFRDVSERCCLAGIILISLFLS